MRQLAIAALEKSRDTGDAATTRTLALAYVAANRPADAMPLLAQISRGESRTIRKRCSPASTPPMRRTRRRPTRQRCAADRTRAQAWAKSLRSDRRARIRRSSTPGWSICKVPNEPHVLSRIGRSLRCVLRHRALRRRAAERATSSALITEADLLKFVWIADPQMSPDGRRVAFVRVVVNEQKDDYETSLWLVPANGAEPPRRLTSGTRDSSPRWSPDGTRLAFVRSVERDGRPQPAQIYLLSLDGGEARAITDLARGAGRPAGRPTASASPSPARRGPDEPRRRATSTGRRRSEVGRPRDHVGRLSQPTAAAGTIPSIPRTCGSSTCRPDRRSPKPLQLTSGHVLRKRPRLGARDGSRLFFTSTRVEEPYYQPQRRRSVRRAGRRRRDREDREHRRQHRQSRACRPTAARSRSSVRCPARRSVRTASPISSSRISPASQRPGAPRNLTADYDFDIGGGIGGDQAAPRGGGSRDPIWSSDGRSIVVVAGEQGDANLMRVDAAGGKPVAGVQGRARRAVVHGVRDGTGARRARVDADQHRRCVRRRCRASGAQPPGRSRSVNDDLFKQLQV